MINVTASSSNITASAGASAIGAAVTATTVSTQASGGIGPAGPATANIGELLDVELDGVEAGNVLRYGNGKWRNYPESDITDGGNF